MVDERSLSQLHYRLIRGLIDTGARPTNSDLADQLSLPVEQVEVLLRSLADIHGVVLHPHTCEPWIIHPFLIDADYQLD